MTWNVQNYVGAPQITDVSTTKKLPLGTIVQAASPTYGAGEFIYLKGVADCLDGSWVHYLTDDGSTALAVANGIGPVAVARAAIVASSYGWFQIQGKGYAKVLASFADNGNLYLTSTAGSADDAVVAGDLIRNAKGASAVDTPSAGLAEVELARPHTTDGLDIGS